MNEFRQLITATLDPLTVLNTVLREETELLAKRRTEELDALLARKMQLLQEVEQADRGRNEWLQRQGYGPDRAELRRFLRDHDTDGSLQRHWDAMIAALRECQTLNEANGSVARQGLAGVHRSLAILRGDDTAASQYSANGLTETTPRGREISQA